MRNRAVPVWLAGVLLLGLVLFLLTWLMPNQV